MDAMKVLIATAGSHGDVLPYIALGKEMHRRGHEVVFYTNPFFAHYLKDCEFRVVLIGRVEDHLAVWSDRNGKQPFKAFQHVTTYFFSLCRPYYDAMQRELDDGDVITVGHPLLLATRFLRETHGIPTATVHLAPVAFRSNLYPSKLLPIWITPKMPALLKNLAWHAMDLFYFDPNVNKPFNELRTEFGLPPLQKVFKKWMSQADAVVGLFPEWFAVEHSDWAVRVNFAGFPLPVIHPEQHLPPEVEAFLQAGEPPVLFTAGTASAMAQDFFATSIKACVRGNIRGIMLTPYTDQMPEHLPEGVVHFKFVPFHLLLPRLAAIVHHGGIGTTGLALQAGVPQLIRPVAYDQFDNANRLVNMLGVAKQLFPAAYNSRSVAYLLRKIIKDVKIRERCRSYAQNLAHEPHAISNACDAILRIAPESSRAYLPPLKRVS
jgi:UDP:flavonoid glycosyltransferase YjiC (YdhE family)